MLAATPAGAIFGALADGLSATFALEPTQRSAWLFEIAHLQALGAALQALGTALHDAHIFIAPAEAGRGFRASIGSLVA